MDTERTHAEEGGGPPHATRPDDDPRKPAPALVEDRVRRALGGVIDPCCRERGISVLDMGLLSSVAVADDTASIEILLTSGWCPFQVDLTEAIVQAAKSVPGIRDADVRITLEQVWSPDRMSPAARRTLRLLPEPSEAGTREAFLARSPAPPAFAAQEA